MLLEVLRFVVVCCWRVMWFDLCILMKCACWSEEWGQRSKIAIKDNSYESVVIWLHESHLTIKATEVIKPSHLECIMAVWLQMTSLLDVKWETLHDSLEYWWEYLGRQWNQLQSDWGQGWRFRDTWERNFELRCSPSTPVNFQMQTLARWCSKTTGTGLESTNQKTYDFEYFKENRSREKKMTGSWGNWRLQRSCWENNQNHHFLSLLLHATAGCSLGNALPCAQAGDGSTSLSALL